MTETCFFLIWNAWCRKWKFVTELVWYHVFSKSSFTVLGNRLAYIARTSWRESSLWKFVVNSILPINLFKNMWPSNLFPYTAKLFVYSLLHWKYVELLKVIGNKSSTSTSSKTYTLELKIFTSFIQRSLQYLNLIMGAIHGWGTPFGR